MILRERTPNRRNEGGAGDDRLPGGRRLPPRERAQATREVGEIYPGKYVEARRLPEKGGLHHGGGKADILGVGV